jgi:hypothetical protein
VANCRHFHDSYRWIRWHFSGRLADFRQRRHLVNSEPLGAMQNWLALSLAQYKISSDLPEDWVSLCMAYRQHICAIAGVISCVLASFSCQAASAIKPKRIVIFYNSGLAELVAGNIRTELKQRSPELLEIYSAPFATAGAAEDERVNNRYADYVAALFPDRRIDLA